MQQTPEQIFLANDKRSYWVRGLYAQAMDRDPIDASNDAQVLARVLAARMVAICLNQPIPEDATDLIDSPTTSMWLISALLVGWQRDPFETSREAETLSMMLGKRANRDCTLPYSQAIKDLRPHMLQSIVDNPIAIDEGNC